MVDPINTGDVSGASEPSQPSGTIDQNLINQLLMFILGSKSDANEDTLKSELTQLESSLPPEQAAQLKEMLADLPTDTGSKNYDSELTEAFTKITAFLAENVPNGLSPQAKQSLDSLMGQMPTDTSSKTYPEEVAEWSAHVSALIASSLPGVLSSSAQQQLKELLNEQPTDSSDKSYAIDVDKWLSTVQVFLAENVPSSLSSNDKAELDAQLKKIQGINPNDKNAAEEMQEASAQLEQMLSGMFF